MTNVPFFDEVGNATGTLSNRYRRRSPYTLLITLYCVSNVHLNSETFSSRTLRQVTVTS